MAHVLRAVKVNVMTEGQASCNAADGLSLMRTTHKCYRNKSGIIWSNERWKVNFNITIPSSPPVYISFFKWKSLFSIFRSRYSVQLFFLDSLTLSRLSSVSLPPHLPSSHSGTMSLPWLGGCNLLQAAGQAERSPSYLDKGSPGKSYQSEGVFKYSRNCGNHFFLSPQSPTSHFKKAPPSVPLNFPSPVSPSGPHHSQFPNIFFPWLSRTASLFPSISSSSIQLILARGVGSGADSCMTRNVSLCKSLLPPCAVLA